MALETIFDSLKKAQARLALQNRQEKDAALRSVIKAIETGRGTILKANTADVEKARAGGMKEALIDRLLLNDERVNDIIEGIDTVIRQDDPIGKIRAGWVLPNGIQVEQTTVPLGVAAIIYESRPNVTADAFSLAYKAGCAILLRGSSAALESNRALVKAIRDGLSAGGGIPDAVALAESGSRDEVDEILQARGKIDVVLPRGGKDLIRRVVDNARIPVIETGQGNCHIYVDGSADIPNAVDIIENAKLQRPGACNAVETLLIHPKALAALMPLVSARLAGKAELRCDSRSKAAIGAPPQGLALRDAVDGDWETEFLDYILAVKTVDTLEEAIAHINRYGTKHSEAILTKDLKAAEEFERQVDAACVYVNASTRFTDGGQFGFGAELGISTQKFHARGPMGLEALTTIKYRIHGSGQIRP
ncbi:glutamate-5-semialdehyde dehydrogenase [Treponema primitia ZAS-2]|uniref:Gamma-glutamyl phosphate reductase n=1 Tax=Treponema primitia (strain ATCC BAA-887 / DSM 12427 / ZAS-2) TaxID=545694 RepID=F5YMH2_TREPZ|nr:glutamate-5-semialdehyde dehydrogenase [Treponema primitia]AEF85468.1 glutamate-5-semialdehyde dehydrogenase [Treponema primitia ZAS-2]